MDYLNDQYANVGMHIFHSGFDLLSGSKKIENIQRTSADFSKTEKCKNAHGYE